MKKRCTFYADKEITYTPLILIISKPTRGICMATPFPEDHQFLKATLEVEEDLPSASYVFYTPIAKNLALANLDTSDPKKYRHTLMYVSGQHDIVTIYPINILPHRPEYLSQKYSKVQAITLEGFGYEAAENEDDIASIVSGFPEGFVKDWRYGLGLKKDYRFIVTAVEEMGDFKEIIISKKNETSFSRENSTFMINIKDYQQTRKGLNTIVNRARSASRRIRNITAYNHMAFFLGSSEFEQKTTIGKNADTLYRLISAETGAYEAGPEDQIDAIEVVSKNRRAIAEKQPEALVKLQEEIELVTLEQLIEKFEIMFAKNHKEDKWQKLFNDNPFILTMAFGYPLIKCHGHAFVGGRRLSGGGDKISDYLVKNGMTNNAALVEIKTPQESLLNKSPYREGVYTPSAGLSGALTQVLDQKYKFQMDINTLKAHSKTYDLETYAVHCVLIVGTTPKDDEQIKSFELFRGNSKDVTIITFDELLQKIKLLHEFLSEGKSTSENGPLGVAKKFLTDMGLDTPPVNDDWWIDVVEWKEFLLNPDTNAGRRWIFPLPFSHEESSHERSMNVASAALQLDWAREGEELNISPLTPPEEIHAYLRRLPVTCPP